MEFVHDQLVTDRGFRALTVIDQWSRESVLLARMRHSPDRASSTRRTPSPSTGRCKAITVNYGTEFTSKALDEWAYRQGVRAGLHSARKAGRERLHRECQRPSPRRMSRCALLRIGRPRAAADSCVARDYNDHRSYGALGRLTPSESAAQGQMRGSNVADLQPTPV